MGGRTPRRVAVLVLQCCVVVLCVGVTVGAASQVQERQLRAATEERVLDVARSLAELDQVQETIGRPDAARELQPLADLVGEASGVDYVVITDAAGIRLTHPTPEERGLPVSTDPSAVLAGEEFLGTESGTLGPTLRAKVPVYRDGVVIGSASVGILESEIAADLRGSLTRLAPWALAALLVGVAGAGLLGILAERRMRRLELEVAELDAQRRTARALREQTHEFRTRLHVIHGLVEGRDTQAALEYIADLVPVTGRAAGGARIDDVRLGALLGALEAELAAAGGRFEIDPATTVADGALDDDDLTVAANLLRNAVEAAGPRGRVRTRIGVGDEQIAVLVEDDGPGVPPALLPRLCDHGFSTKPSDDATASRGIGLALVRRIVDGRRGTLEIGRSTLGGARFTVAMPRAAGAPRDRVESNR